MHNRRMMTRSRAANINNNPPDLFAYEVLPPSTQFPKSSAPQKPQRKHNGANYSSIDLRARVYDSVSIHRSHLKGNHLGSSCDPVTEVILLKRNSNQIDKWEKLATPPTYFEGVQADANISGGACSSSSFPRQLGLSESIQEMIARYDTLKYECNKACTKTYYGREETVPYHSWPVGLEGSLHNYRSCIDPELLRAVSKSTMDLECMAREVFKLSDSAVSNVLAKKTSLLREVSAVCGRWHQERQLLAMPCHVPRNYHPITTLIGPYERFLELKVGIYYMLERGTVIKFMVRPTALEDFVSEADFGYSVEDNIKGVVGIIGTCPEAFCIEMEFAGVSLRDVINGDNDCALNHPRRIRSSLEESIQHHMRPIIAKGGLYGVKMLQVTGRLPEELQKFCQNPISDSHSATGVTNRMRDRLLDELPFVLVEIVNIVTRLSQQGVVNPDIKSDNIVIDGLTGQPKMIDFGLVIPAGKRDTGHAVVSSSATVYSDYPQTPPEYLTSGRCEEAAMTYGLSFMLNDVLNTLAIRTGDMSAISLSNNIPLRSFLAKAYSENPAERPRAFLIAPLIGRCFPFRPNIAKLFDRQQHTIAMVPPNIFYGPLWGGEY